MSDDLRKHIDEHRETFECYPFDEDEGWAQLSRKLEDKKPSSSNWWYVAAASVIVALGFSLSLSVNSSSAPQFTAELQETQHYYQEMIDSKITLVREKIGDESILQDLSLLDAAFSELSDDLGDGAQNDEVVRAMIDNYRLKLKILEEILEDLDEDSNEEDINI